MARHIARPTILALLVIRQTQPRKKPMVARVSLQLGLERTSRRRPCTRTDEAIKHVLLPCRHHSYRSNARLTRGRDRRGACVVCKRRDGTDRRVQPVVGRHGIALSFGKQGFGTCHPCSSCADLAFRSEITRSSGTSNWSSENRSTRFQCGPASLNPRYVS